ncbi:MAG: hypothetical protein U0Y68_01635 [Blastocatellia bacterium]
MAKAAGGVRNARWYERVRQNILDYEQWCFEWATELFRVCKKGAIVATFNSTRARCFAIAHSDWNAQAFMRAIALSIGVPAGFPKG